MLSWSCLRGNLTLREEMLVEDVLPKTAGILLCCVDKTEEAFSVLMTMSAAPKKEL